MSPVGALTAPSAGQGQQPGKIHRIGFLCSSACTSPFFRELRDALREQGYADGQNRIIHQRSTEGKLERLPAVAAELVGLNLRAARILGLTVPPSLLLRADQVIE